MKNQKRERTIEPLRDVVLRDGVLEPYLFPPRTLLDRIIIGCRGWAVRGVFCVACGLLVLMACGADIRDTLGKIRRVQIISIVADPPEAGPGNSVTFQATAVDPETWGTGNDQMVYYWVFFYLDPSAAIDLNIDLNNFNLSDLVGFLAQCPETPGCEIMIGEGNPWTIQLPDRKPPEGKFIPYSVFLLAADSAATLAAVIQGQDVPGKYDLAAKSVKASENPTVNHNPIIQTISAPPAVPEGTPGRFRAKPEEKVTLIAQAIDPDEVDLLSYRWWILKGRLEDDNLDQVQWTTPKDPGFYPVYLVVRDKVEKEPKGGQTVAEIQVEVVEPMSGPP
ncbi:MAG: hypothetical protein NT009_04220 [Proteobacteria bacterium]|nr:hypothetical protein [Pseudomonadota bacterium]